MSNAAISPWQIIKNIKAKSEAFKPSKSNLFEKQETTHEVSIFCKTNKKSWPQYFDVQMQSNIQFNNKKTVLHLNKLRAQIQTKNLSSMIYEILSYKPCGLIWNGNNYSCGYDALFTICNDRYNHVICHHINTCPCCHDPILHNHMTFPHTFMFPSLYVSWPVPQSCYAHIPCCTPISPDSIMSFDLTCRSI